MISRCAPLAVAALALALSLVGPVAAQAGSEPIPGIDIIVQKKPGGTAIVAATTGRDGRFSAPVKLEPGQYDVTTACRSRGPCPAHQLTSLMVDGQPARKVEEAPGQKRGDRNGIGIYIVGAVVLGMRAAPPVVISGQVIGSPSTALSAVKPDVLNRPVVGTVTPQGLSPYAGIDIMFGNGKLAKVVGTTDVGGRFLGEARVEAGEYEVTAACPPRRACAPLRLTSVRIDGRALTPDAGGRFVFSVRPGVRSVMVDANSALQEVSLTR